MATRVKPYTKKDGTKVKGYAVYVKDRRTPILVDGKLSRKAAIQKALSIKKRGSNKIDLVRRLTDKEQAKANKGKWVSGYEVNPERKNLRGVGPKPAGFDYSTFFSNLIEFAKVEKDIKVNSYRTKKGKKVNPFRRRQKVVVEQEKETGTNLKTLGIQVGLMGAALAVPLIPVGISKVRNKASSIRTTQYKAQAAKALPAPVLGKGEFGSAQNISESQVGKVLQPYNTAKLITKDGVKDIVEDHKKVKSIITSRNKEFNILTKLKDTGVTPKPGKLNKFGFTMEKIEGDTLYDFVTNKLQEPTLEQMQTLGVEMGQAVSKIHKKGVYHGDLHLNNLIVDNKGKAKIIDFGEAILVDKTKREVAFKEDINKVITGMSSALEGEYTTRESYKSAQEKASSFQKGFYSGYRS